DLSLVEIGNSVGSNAAREGARYGIIHYVDADLAGTANNTGVINAVKAKLAGLLSGTPNVDVKCLKASTLAVVPNGCQQLPDGGDQSLYVILDTDLIQVTVTWQHLGATPLVAN